MAYNVLVYIAIVSQTGTADPVVVNELANGFNKVITFDRVDVGTYTINAASTEDVFVVGSTVVQVGPTGGFTFAGNTNELTCYLNTYDTSGAIDDGQLINTLVEIRSFINS